MASNERFIEFIDIPIELASRIIRSHDESISISKVSKVESGRANSNYILNTSIGKLLLRVCRNKSTYDNEIVINSVLDKSVNRPELLFNINIDEKLFLIYKYIESDSLGRVEIISDDTIKQVAILSAKVHNTPIEDVKDIEKLDLPPFSIWYDYFLDNKNTTKRLGVDVKRRIKSIIANSSDRLKDIDSMHSVIHNDFSLDNLIIDKDGKVFITDWEWITVNHTLTDMGQFFRLSDKFTNSQLELFEKYYNLLANIHLPSNWYELMKLRDLVNLLQLISSERDLPSYHEALRNLIIKTVEYFESK